MAPGADKVGSLLELLQGRLSDHVMAVVTDKERGLFPLPGEISLDCSCPDWADMCKHVAAVMYGVGARLDQKPELLFVLRGVNHAELVAADTAKAVVTKAKKAGQRTLDESELSEVFGIDVAPAPVTKTTAGTAETKSARPAARRSAQRAQKPSRRTVPAAAPERATARRSGRKRAIGE